MFVRSDTSGSSALARSIPALTSGAILPASATKSVSWPRCDSALCLIPAGSGAPVIAALSWPSAAVTAARLGGAGSGGAADSQLENAVRAPDKAPLIASTALLIAVRCAAASASAWSARSSRLASAAPTRPLIRPSMLPPIPVASCCSRPRSPNSDSTLVAASETNFGSFSG